MEQNIWRRFVYAYSHGIKTGANLTMLNPITKLLLYLVFKQIYSQIKLIDAIVITK